MGLSLFSSPTSGKLFTAAVTTLEKQTDGDLKATKATKACTNEEQEKEDETQAEDANEVADANEDGETAGDDPTGEEDEEVIFRADCKLWKLVKVCPEGEPKSEEAACRKPTIGVAVARARLWHCAHQQAQDHRSRSFGNAHARRLEAAAEHAHLSKYKVRKSWREICALCRCGY